MPDHHYGRYLNAPDFINRYIFPGSCCPSLHAISEAVARETAQRVAVLDLDLQLGDTAVLLGFVPEYTVADAAAGAERLEPELLQSLMWSDKNGVYVLPAPLRPEEAEDITADQIRSIITIMARTFYYVIVDTPPQVSDPVAACPRSRSRTFAP